MLRPYLLMKIALFGGSFNPPQNGHVAVAKALLDSQQFDEVWVLPSFQHPFGKALALFKDRVTLCRLAFGDLSPSLRISEAEKEMDNKKGYSIDTVRFLKKKYADHQFSLVMGSDLLLESSKWKDFEELKKLIEIYPISRAGYEETKFPHVSSSQVRNALAKGEDISFLVPASVLKYIEEKGLYKSPLSPL